jgi:hypothetical protein
MAGSCQSTSTTPHTTNATAAPAAHDASAFRRRADDTDGADEQHGGDDAAVGADGEDRVGIEPLGRVDRPGRGLEGLGAGPGDDGGTPGASGGRPRQRLALVDRLARRGDTGRAHDRDQRCRDDEKHQPGRSGDPQARGSRARPGTDSGRRRGRADRERGRQGTEVRRRGRHHDASRQRTHGQGPGGAAPAPEWDEARSARHGQQHPVALRRDQRREHQAQCDADHRRVEVQAERQHERDGEHSGGTGGVGERSGQLPEAARVLCQRGDAPHHRHQPDRRGDGGDDHHRKGDAPPVAIVECPDHHEGTQEPEERGAEREERGGVVGENRPDHPPDREPAHGERDGRGRTVLEAEQRQDGDDARHHGHAERIGRVEGPFPVDRGGHHADDEGRHGGCAARLGVGLFLGRFLHGVARVGVSHGQDAHLVRLTVVGFERAHSGPSNRGSTVGTKPRADEALIAPQPRRLRAASYTVGPRRWSRGPRFGGDRWGTHPPFNAGRARGRAR